MEDQSQYLENFDGTFSKGAFKAVFGEKERFWRPSDSAALHRSSGQCFNQKIMLKSRLAISKHLQD